MVLTVLSFSSITRLTPPSGNSFKKGMGNDPFTYTMCSIKFDSGNLGMCFCTCTLNYMIKNQASSCCNVRMDEDTNKMCLTTLELSTVYVAPALTGLCVALSRTYAH